MSALLESLNVQQRAAASHLEGPLLILAGAGSGKTRVITHRVAWLVKEAGVSLSEILAVTFTNKAAGEMRSRVAKLLGAGAEEVWISTFHSAGVRMLREHGEAVGVPPGFVIYDDSDQLSLIKRILKDSGTDTSFITPRTVRSRIDYAKSCGLGPDAMDIDRGDPTGEEVREIYRRYQAALRSSGAVDFGDLLVETVSMLRNHSAVLDAYRRRLRFFMVDEFQDTSPVQYELVRLLAGPAENLVVVGDDDQSIYGWRGADVRNILSFETDYPKARVIRLEQNYRSTQVILDAAHAIIEKSPERKKKRLWTERRGGDLLELIAAKDEVEEARLAAFRVELLSNTVPRNEIAILYRTNAMSRVVEDALRARRVPYQVVRGRSFYERAEIRDLTAYLRLAVNPHSDADLLRIINTPRRGIGSRTVERLRSAGDEAGTSLWSVIWDSHKPLDLGQAASRRVRSFAELIRALHDLVIKGSSAYEVVKESMIRSGLVAAFESDVSEEGRERLENLTELLAVAAQREDEGYSLVDLLDEMALLGDADEKVEGERVALMTLHAAKGLEFDVVMMLGVEERTLPHARVFTDTAAFEDPEALAEERRLCYVGFTRARSKLVLGMARTRWVMGSRQVRGASRFLGELPAELLGERSRAQPRYERACGSLGRHESQGVEVHPSKEEIILDYSFDQRPEVEEVAPRPGGRVRHSLLGDGEIRRVDGFGHNARFEVRFDSGSVKRVLARYLQVLW